MKIVAGVDVAKVNKFILEAAYAKALGKEPKGATAKLVEELSTHYQKVAGAEILECDNCGGGSPPTLDACPFCGEGEEPLSSDESLGADVPDSEPPASEADPETVVEPEQHEPDPTAINAVEMGIEEEEPKRRKKKPVAPPPKVPAPSTPALSLVVAPKAPLVTVADLDQALSRVKKARDAGAEALWEMSVELRAIYDGNLWKLRNDESGAPAYKSFAKFIAAEVDLHERTVWRMIEVTREFKPEQAQTYGVSILRGLLAAPKEDRAEILEKLDKGQIAGKRGVEREVAEIRKRKKVKVLESKTGRTKAASEAAAKAAEKKRMVTAALPAGRKTIPLFARAAAKGDEEKRAKTVADKPWGKLACANGVTLYAALVENKDGELELTVEARRDDEE